MISNVIQYKIHEMKRIKGNKYNLSLHFSLDLYLNSSLKHVTGWRKTSAVL